MNEKKHDSEETDIIRVGENAYVPVRYVDEDGDVLEYDDDSCEWIARNDKGEIVKKIRF